MGSTVVAAKSVEKKNKAPASAEIASDVSQLKQSCGATAGVPRFLRVGYGFADGSSPIQGNIPFRLGEGRGGSAAPIRGLATAPRSNAAMPPVGNQALQRHFGSGAIHAKLAVGQPNDPLERQADEVADRVMRRVEVPSIQRKCAACAAGGEACEECQKKHDQAGGLVRRRATTNATQLAAPPIVHQTLATSGCPLDSATRTDMESRFGRDFGDVRVHTDRSATQSASAIDALAYAAGSHIVFGHGQFAPQADAGRRLLAHELAHVAQAQDMRASSGAAFGARDELAEPHTDREQPGVVRRKEEPPFVIVPVAGTAEPLAGYAAMRERLTPSDWNALNAAARRRADTIISGQQPVRENELVKTEISAPVQDLFQPEVNQSKASGGDQWLRDVYALAHGAAGAMSQRIQDEILYGWIAANEGIMQEPVTIALVDPEGKAGGSGGVLTFLLRRRPVASANGLLTLPNVDKAIGGSVDDSIARMNGELNTLVATIQKVDTAKAMIAAAGDIVGQGHDKIAAQSLDQIDAAMRKAAADLGSVTGDPFSELVRPAMAELSGFLDGDFAAYRKADIEWRVAHPRQKSDYERQSEELEKEFKEEQEHPTIFGKQYIVDKARMLGNQDIAMGGAPDQQRALGQAYDQGLISYASWSEGVAKAERRGEIFGGVTLALTLATAGLGFFVTPVTLGGAVLLGAGTGLVLATGPMLASNLYTSNVDFDDPALQQWWKAGAYSGRDIAVAGLVGAGIGAAFPIAGKVLGGLRGQGVQAVAALEAGAAMPEGVVARTVGKGVVELTIPSEGVTIRVSESGYQVIGRAGSNAAAVLEEGVWPAEMAGQGRVDLAHPRYPTSVAFGQRGWGMISPQSSLPVQLGLWPELALPPGAVAEPAATVSPLLLDAASGVPVTSIVGSDRSLVLAGANIPQGVPMTPPPMMLGAGPVPFGLLPEPFPDISYVGPTVPQSFEQSVTRQWGTQVAQSGGSMLPYVGEGGVWLRLPSGEWAPAYYPTRPGGIPPASLVTYGQTNPNFLVDAPGANRSAFIQPRPGGSYPGARNFPMPTTDMFDPVTGMTHGRGHLVPHRSTPAPGPGQMLSTVDPRNFVAHPRKYNEWIRNQLEQMLKREGATYTAHDVIGPNPRLTTGGYIIPEAEVFVQYGANGAPVRSWRFPLAANPAYYETLSGSFKDVLGQFEIKLSEVPVTPIRK
jgi:hypothetical protein